MADGGLRNRLGHFVRQAVAAPAEAPEAIDPAEAAAVEDVLDDLPATPADLFAKLAACREQRGPLLRSGDVAAVLAIDSEIARLTVAIEVAGARADELQLEAAGRERARLLDIWRRVQQPKLEAAHARRDELAYLLWLAVDAAADAEADAAGIANMLGITLGQTPRDSMLSRYLWEIWASNHARRLGLMPRAA
jgi:hypothetical protein